MKISILLPYKENFSPIYPGAVSLFVYETSKISKYKKNITVFGNTDFKKIFNLRYVNINTKKTLFNSQTKTYVNDFIKIEKKINSSIIEVHNRPSYIHIINEKLKNKILTLYFHNDPLSMEGSKTIAQRKKLLRTCYKIISITKVLDKYKNWKALIIGDEKREKINLKHKSASILGFKKHEEVIKIFKKTSITVAPSRWDEPFGRTSLEASASGCAVIITNKGGLPETVTDAKILEKLNEKNLTKSISQLIENKKDRISLQRKSITNFYLTHKFVSKKIDDYRSEKLFLKNNFFIKSKLKNLRILHVTNFNERLDGRLFFNTGRRINNGFIRLGHSVLGFSDRDILKYYKSIGDLKGQKTLNDKLKKTCYNYKPDLIVTGHADLISKEQIQELKEDNPNTKFAQWFLDPLNKNGPDFERNKERILDKIDVMDGTFLTTSPSALNFLPKNNKNFYIPNPSDHSFETLNNYNKSCSVDVFFALSHGVHRGKLKSGKEDDRIIFLEKLQKITSDIKFDLYGINNVQPIWADHYFKTISNAKMGLNLSRGEAIKYYSSDRITQIVGNGLVCLIDEKTQYRDFFSNNEMVFYKSLSDLSEKIIKVSRDDKLRRKIAHNGKKKYMKYFNSTQVANFIINKTLEIKDKKYLWEK